MESFLSEELIIILFFAVFPFLSFLFIFRSIRRQAAQKEELKKAASGLGLSPSEPSELQDPQVQKMLASVPQFLKDLAMISTGNRFTGQSGGYEVSLYTEVRGSGKSKKIYTVMHTAFREPLNSEISITKEGFFGKVADLIGFPDVKVQDKELDSLLRIRCESEVFAKTFLLSGSHREAVKRIFSKYSDLRIDRYGITLEWNQYMTDASVLRTAMNDLTETAGILTEF